MLDLSSTPQHSKRNCVMNTLFKKHFWAVKLAGLALLALVSAGIVSVLIGARFFAMPTEPTDAKGTEASDDVATDGRLERDLTATQFLRERRIFTADWPAKPVPLEDATTDDEGPEEKKERSDTLAESKLPITLIGTFVAETAQYSYADMQIQGENKIASVGSTYLDGEATVMRIAPGHIILKEPASYTFIRVWQDRNPDSAAAATPGGDAAYNLKGSMPGSPMGRPASIAPDADKSDPSAGVTKTGAYDYQVSRSMIDKELGDMAKLQREARVVPHFKDNQYQGFKLVGVRPGSLYRSLGIRSGDIITSVNGTKIDNPGKALELFDQLKKSSNINVDIERRGQPRQLTYSIQ